MSNEDEEARVKENQQVIRKYLFGQFGGFQLTEDTPDRPLWHKFTMTKLKPLEQYRLIVSWPKISDGDNTPAKIKQLLVTDDVANRMRDKQGEYFPWGNF